MWGFRGFRSRGEGIRNQGFGIEGLGIWIFERIARDRRGTANGIVGCFAGVRGTHWGLPCRFFLCPGCHAQALL